MQKKKKIFELTLKSVINGVFFSLLFYRDRLRRQHVFRIT